jgi:hypothetical protein
MIDAARNDSATFSSEEHANESGERRPLQRFPRFQSHALVDVKTSSWNPFASFSAVLLDLSVQGFKIEFVSPVTIHAGERARLVIPLSPFRILSPERLKLRIVVKWFDARNQRAGGVFEGATAADAHVIEKILDRLLSQETARA